MLVSSEKPSPNSSTERDEDARLAGTVDNEVGQDLVNIGISHSSIDSSIDKITQENHNNTADENDEVSLSFEMTQTGSEIESDVSLWQTEYVELMPLVTILIVL